MTPAALDMVFALVERAANAGEVCPTNRAIADALGWGSIATASRAIDLLESAGRIAVERTRASRVVTVAATKKSTARKGRARRAGPAPVDARPGGAAEREPRDAPSCRTVHRPARAGPLPDPFAEAEIRQRWHVSMAQTVAEQKCRRESGLPLTKLAIRPGFAGGPARTCQWIEGDPSPDDDCKCGAPSAPGHSWCPDHLVRSVDPEARARVDRQLGIARETARGRAA